MWTDDEQDKALSTLREILDETHDLDRRAFMRRLTQAAASSAALGVFAGVLGARAAAAATPVTYMGWGGAWEESQKKAYYEPWTKLTGIPVKYVSPMSLPKLKAMQEAGKMEIDVTVCGSVDAPRAMKWGLAAPLDFNVIDRSKLTPNQLQYGDLGIGGISVSFVLAYNKKKWPGADHPKSWADFWDVKKFPGARALDRRIFPTLEEALMADGVEANSKEMYPIDVDRAFKSLDRIKPHIKVWHNSGAQQQQLMLDQEVDLIAAWNGRAADAIINQGAAYEMVWNQACYGGNSEAWILLKGAPNPKDAMRLLDFVGRPEPQAAFARLLFYGPLNLNAYQHIPENIAKHLPSYKANVAVQHSIQFDWWAEHFDAMTARFEKWVQS